MDHNSWLWWHPAMGILTRMLSWCSSGISISDTTQSHHAIIMFMCDKHHHVWCFPKSGISQVFLCNQLVMPSIKHHSKRPLKKTPDFITAGNRASFFVCFIWRFHLLYCHARGGGGGVAVVVVGAPIYRGAARAWASLNGLPSPWTYKYRWIFLRYHNLTISYRAWCWHDAGSYFCLWWGGWWWRFWCLYWLCNR